MRVRVATCRALRLSLRSSTAVARVMAEQRGPQVMADDADELLLELRPLAQLCLDALALADVPGDFHEAPVDAVLVRECAQRHLGRVALAPLADPDALALVDAVLGGLPHLPLG